MTQQKLDFMNRKAGIPVKTSGKFLTSTRSRNFSAVISSNRIVRMCI
jgi:hypothetical protein